VRNSDTTILFSINPVSSAGFTKTVEEPIAASYSTPGVLAEAAYKTGRAKVDFELREIDRKDYEFIAQTFMITSELYIF
jgi:hypothetical protein